MLELPALCDLCASALAWKKRRGAWLCRPCLVTVILHEACNQPPPERSTRDMDPLGLLSKFLPEVKALAFLRSLPLAVKVLGVVANVDADHDGTISGPEKKQVAVKIAQTLLAAVPGMTEERAGRIVQAAVDLFNGLAGR